MPPEPTGSSRSSLATAGYQSELTLTNFTAAPLALTLTYTGSPQLSASGSGSVPLTLAARRTEDRIRRDGLSQKSSVSRSRRGSVGGALLVKAPAGNARLFTRGRRAHVHECRGRRHLRALLPRPDAGRERDGARVRQRPAAERRPALEPRGRQPRRRGRYDHAAGSRTTAPDGAALPNPETATLAPGEWKQFNGPLASRGATAGIAKVERLSGYVPLGRVRRPQRPAQLRRQLHPDESRPVDAASGACRVVPRPFI